MNKELEFKSGLPTQFTAIQGNDINTIDILTNTETGKNEIHFSDPSAWSWFYHGTLVVVENIRVDITNEYVGEDEEPGDEEPGDEEPGDEEPGDEEPGDEEDEDDEDDDEETEPTPTPTPTTTPTEPSEPSEPSEPTESPEPTETPEPASTSRPFPRPTTTPEIEIDDDELPGGSVEDEDDEIILDDDVIPGGPGQLPKTGELPPVVFYSTGSLIAAIGYKLRGKRKE